MSTNQNQDKSTEINKLPFKNIPVVPQPPPPQQGPPGIENPRPPQQGPPGIYDSSQDPRPPPGQNLRPPQQPQQSVTKKEKYAQGKEYFNVKSQDYKLAVVVFSLVLIFSSNIFFEALNKYLPWVKVNNSVTIVGSLVAALISAILFFIIKVACNI